MSTGRMRFPHIGTRYLLIRGAWKGRLCVVRECCAGGKDTNSKYIVDLCDSWGAPTTYRVVVRLREIEP